LRVDVRERGLTLVELMVAVVIAGIAMAAAFSLGYAMMDGYREHRRSVEVERSARASMQAIADAVRNASVGVPSGELEDLVSCTGRGPLFVENHSDGPDRLQIVHGTGGALTEIWDGAFNLGVGQILVHDAGGFRPGDQVIVADTETGKLVSVIDVDHSTNVLQVDTNCPGTSWPAGGYGRGSMVIRAQVSGFAIDDSGDVPVLLMSPTGLPDVLGAVLPDTWEAHPVALGVEDLQVAVGVDHTGDGMVDTWHYSAVGDDDPPDPSVTPWRALRLTLVARSFQESSDQPMSARPAAEDRPGEEEMDEFRRRVLTTIVELRNLEGSP
jgi:prepilin-type N-terminal cleavage/methylation domain-containing protein